MTPRGAAPPSRGALLVGLTGGIATGKSTIAGMFRELGAAVIDADRIVHELLSAGGAAVAPIAESFGKGFVAADGSIDRGRLGALVFQDDAAKERLEAIVHPFVETESERRIAVEAAKGSRVVLYDAPLLIEAGHHERFDRLVVVTARPAVQIERLMARDGLSTDDAGARVRTQLPLASKEKLADFVIENSGPWHETRAQVARVYERLREEALRRAE